MSTLTFITNNCYVDYISKYFFKFELNKYINEIKYTHFFFLVLNVAIKIFITYVIALVVLVIFFLYSGDLMLFEMLIIPSEKKPEGQFIRH